MALQLCLMTMGFIKCGGALVQVATPLPSSSPSATPEARTSMPATEEGIPQPGVLTPTFFLFIMGLGLLAGGFFLRFFKCNL